MSTRVVVVNPSPSNHLSLRVYVQTQIGENWPEQHRVDLNKGEAYETTLYKGKRLIIEEDTTPAQ